MYGGDKVAKERNEDEEDEIIGADEDIEGIKVGVKRGRTDGEQVMDRRQLKRQKKALVHKYYSGNFYFKCCANIMY